MKTFTDAFMFDELSRLERRIMAVLFRLHEATALTVAEELDGPDTYDTVRVTLRGLERRGKVRHRREGNRHVYIPTQSRARASRKAAVDLLRTFFADSPSQAILALLDAADRDLTQEELDAIEGRIEQARRERSS